MDPILNHVIVVVVGFVCFFLSFCAIWKISLVASRTYPTLAVYDKADWCSRGNSTLHALIIIPGFIGTLATTTWNYSTLEPTSSPAGMQFFMCISVSYFMFDLVVLLVFAIPMWGVYIAHHVLASLPYFIYLFDRLPRGRVPSRHFPPRRDRNPHPELTNVSYRDREGELAAVS